MVDKQPHIRVGIGGVAPFVLLPGDPARVDAVGRQLDEWHPVAYNREFRTITGVFQGMPVSVTSTGIGGPSAAIAVEELIRLGARILIRIGSAGAMRKGMRIGDLVIGEGAVREDGASAMYVPPAYPAVAAPRVVQSLSKAAEGMGVTCHYGILRSHDSFYTDREEELMQYWSKEGVIASDMETAALFTVARLRGALAGSVLNIVVPFEGDLEGGINDLVSGEQAALAGETAEIQVALRALRLMWEEELA
jgi:uridine phosphorylase